jgi:hypothetical protein
MKESYTDQILSMTKRIKEVVGEDTADVKKHSKTIRDFGSYTNSIDNDSSQAKNILKAGFSFMARLREAERLAIEIEKLVSEK